MRLGGIIMYRESLLLLTILACSSLVFGASDPGTIALWHFDKVGAGDSIFDASGNNINGKIAGATWVDQGLGGTALKFAGTKTSLVQFQNYDQLNLTGDFSIELWILPDPSDISLFSFLINKHQGSNDQDSSWAMEYSAQYDCAYFLKRSLNFPLQAYR